MNSETREEQVYFAIGIAAGLAISFKFTPEYEKQVLSTAANVLNKLGKPGMSAREGRLVSRCLSLLTEVNQFD